MEVLFTDTQLLKIQMRHIIFENFNIITPNTTFELSEASSTIRFGIFLTSTGAVPAMVSDFAVQLDIGDASIKFNPAP